LSPRGLVAGFLVVGAMGAAAFLSRPELARSGLHNAAGRLSSLVAPASRPAVRPATPAGLSLWTVDDSTKVFPGDELGPPRSPGPDANPLRLEGALGETVAFQVVLASSSGGVRVEVEVPELRGGAGSIPRKQINVFLESYLSCPAVNEKVVSLGPGEYPDALVPLWENGPDSRAIASPIAVPERRNVVLWVDVSIPRTAVAGSYAGHLRLSPRGAASASAGPEPLDLPLELTVLPFEIPAAPHLSAWVPLYETRLWKREDLDSLGEGQANAVVQRYYRMAHAHRFVTQLIEDEPRIEWDKTAGSLLQVDWSGYDALNGPALSGELFEDGEPPALWKVGGFVWWGARPGDPPNFGGDFQKDSDLTPAHRRALAEYAREITRHFRERGWSHTQLFMYMIDEPDFEEHPNRAKLVKAYGDSLHAAGTPIRHLVTIAPGDSPITLGAVDIWATWGAGYRPREMQARQKLGEKAWFYQQHEPFVGGNCVNDEGLGMRSWPWIAWRYGVDGVFLWVGNYWNQDPYREAQNWNKMLLGNGVLFYPGHLLPTIGFPAITGPVSSFRMKALRRGLYDYEYFYLLRSLGGDADALVARVVRHALNDKEAEPYWDHPLWHKHGDWSHDPADWDRARHLAAQDILKLRPR
jgi:hypothetical protein